MNCYLCGADRYKVIHKGVRGADDIDVLQCNNCGLVFLSKFLENPDSFYENSQMRGANETLQEIRKATWRDDERRYQTFRGVIENKMVLDFGCGAGGFLDLARKSAGKVYGIELDEYMRKLLSVDGIKCFSSIDEGEEFARRGGVSWDFISLFHVLEHLPDPVNLLQRISRLKSKDGKIIIEVPNANDALLTLYGNDNFADFTYWRCHLYLFTTETLKAIVQKSGLKVKFIQQVQRYSLANHLMWLTKGKPGGHIKWAMLDDRDINKLYGQKLAGLGIADTIIMEAY